MKGREWYEDSIQSVLRKCLPKMPPSNIRPAYQKTKQTNPMGLNHMDVYDPLKDGVRAATNEDNLVYFWLHFDPLDLLSTEVGDTISTVVPFKLTVMCYGKDSMPNAIRVRAYLRSPEVLTEMLDMDSVLKDEPRMTTFPEEHAGEWWERSDVEFSIDVLIDDLLDGELMPTGGDASGYSGASGGEVVVEEVGDGN